MTRKVTRRIIIVVLIVSMVVIVAVALTIVSWIRTGKPSSARVEAKMQDGLEYGKTTNQQGCISEGLERGARMAVFNFQDQADNENFVLGCLKSSAPSPRFCEGVPSGLKNIFIDWTEKKCEKINMAQSICTGIFDQQITFCEQ